MIWAGLAIALLIVPGWSDFATAPRLALLFLLVPLLLRGTRWSLVASLLALWLVLSGISILWAPIRWFALGDWLVVGLFVGAFFVGQRADSDKLLLGLALGLCISVAVAVAQRFGWTGIPQATQANGFVLGPAGLLGNKNFLGECCAITCVWAFYSKQKFLGSVLLLGVALTVTRAAWLALFVVALLEAFRYYPKLTICVGTALSVVAALLLDANTLGLRWIMWEATLHHLSWFGHGEGSFYTLFPGLGSTYDLFQDRPTHLHNEALEWVFELGGLSIVPIIAFLLASVLPGDRACRRSLLAAYAIGFFSFPLQLPVSLLLVGCLAGRADRMRPLLCDQCWNWAVRVRDFIADRKYGRG